jgi:hypothetical protein
MLPHFSASVGVSCIKFAELALSGSAWLSNMKVTVSTVLHCSSVPANQLQGDPRACLHYIMAALHAYCVTNTVQYHMRRTAFAFHQACARSDRLAVVGLGNKGPRTDCCRLG